MSVDIEKVAIATVADSLKIDASGITVESRFVDDLKADSLDVVELMMSLEAKFDINIPDEDASKLVTVSDAIDYIKANQK